MNSWKKSEYLIIHLLFNYFPQKPLFLYLPFTAVHGPTEVPERYKKPYEALVIDDSRRALLGMCTCLDEAIKNITQTLKETGMYENTIIIFMSGKRWNNIDNKRRHT